MEQEGFRQTIRRWYGEHRGWLGYLTIFVAAFLLFASFQYLTIFADPDSFYHAKLAVLLRDGVLMKTFTALPFTTLASAYADQHFLYHLLLVPFVTVFDPLIGLKIATAVFGALLALGFYAFLRRWNVPWALLTTVVLLLVNPFTFRMNLAKASSISVLVLMLGIWAAFSYRPKILAAIAFLYVWLHGGFPLLAVAVVTYAVVSVVHRKVTRTVDSNTLLHRIRGLLGRAFRHQRIRHLNGRLVVAVALGMAAGLAASPFFPKNLTFYFDQLVRIGIVNYQKTIGVGGEWYPYGFIELIANTVLVSIPLVVAVVLFVLQFRRQSPRSITLFLLWLFFLGLTLKSRRYVEYYVPFALLFAAVSLSESLRGFRWRELRRTILDVYLKNLLLRILAVALAVYVAILLPTVVIRDFVSERKDLENGFSLTLFRDESAWIRDHTNPGAVVFHSDWDEFPTLFYWNSDRRYMAGLDPTFLYLADKDRYWQWVNVTLGKERGDVFDIVRGRFDADVVFVERDHGPMEALLRGDQRFTLAYEGPVADVYRVAPAGTEVVPMESADQ